MTVTFRIGELAERAGIKTSTIRYYESQGLMPQPRRQANGYRRYTEQDLARLRFVLTARRSGLQLDDIADVLSVCDSGSFPCDRVRQRAQERLATIEQQIAKLREVQRRLIEICNQDGETHQPHDAGEICPILSAQDAATA